MANEQYSEQLVEIEMNIRKGENSFGFVFPQGDVQGIKKPEYIIAFSKNSNIIDICVGSRGFLHSGNCFDEKILNKPQKQNIEVELINLSILPYSKGR
jgi:hypothetical protein